MPHLILDIGNTRSKLAVLIDGAIVNVKAVEKLDSEVIADVCSCYDVDAAIASVVGRMPDFNTLIPSHLISRFHLLSYRSHLPVTLDYETPETLGMDRVAAAVGARELSGCQDPLLVVDAGSCITIDLLDQNDVFRGGAIAPGLRMRFRALHDYTAALPLVEPDDQFILLGGRNTNDSILAGVQEAAALEIQAFAERYRAKMPSLKLFLTGGDADFFAKRLFFPKFANPNLMYIGLDKILKMNI